MPLDAVMTRTRELLSKYEMEPPASLKTFLPLCDGRSGKCFEDAERIVLRAGPNSGLMLVHGKCRAPDGSQIHHAWVDVPGGLVYDAVLRRIYPWNAYQGTVLAVPVRR